MNTYSEFSNKHIDAAYINALVDLVNACRKNGIEINKVTHFQNGWQVTFKEFDHADAICHDGSYGSPNYMAHMNDNSYPNDWSITGPWETIGFPWDNNGVSVHDAEELAFFLRALKDRERVGYLPMPWEEDEVDNIPDDVDESNYDPYCGCDIYETEEVW